MSLIFDTKEDLHLQMVDLQKKLKESEEERRKLEKTCNALIRAFREDERMHYKALNNQYESFLEDCRLRKKRNDIILKSLYRVEDRAKSLFNKTEKLKLLKDRYTDYLKQNDFLKKEEILNEAGPKLKASTKGGMTSKSVHWKTPDLEDVIDHGADNIHDLDENLKMEGLLEMSKNNVNKQILPNSLRSNEQNNDLYTFLLKNENENVLANFTNNKGKMSPQEDNQTKSLCTDIENREREDISNEIESEKEFSRSNASIKNSALIQPLAIKDDEQTFQITSEETNVYSKDKIIDHPTVSSNILNSNFLLKNSLFRNIPYTFEKTVTDNSASSVLELKMPFQPLNTENDQPGKLEEKDFDPKISALKDVKDQESFGDSKQSTRDYSSEENVKDSTLDVKSIKITSEEVINGEGNHEKIFENDYNSGSSIDFTKENTSFSHEIEKGKDSEMFQKDANSGFSSDNKIYPKGLDGIDYENETYPDSYYEQPEPSRNLSSIASNVILEEDEYDLEADHEKVLNFNDAQHVLASNLIETNMQPAENDTEKSSNPSVLSLNLSNQENGYAYKNEPLQTFEAKYSDVEKGDKFSVSSVENFQILSDHLEQLSSTEGTDSEKSFKQPRASDLPTDEYQSSIREAQGFEDKEGNKSLIRSNLIHLLESDSESFQIEHGEPISGNEDSDFDFSFKL